MIFDGKMPEFYIKIFRMLGVPPVPLPLPSPTPVCIAARVRLLFQIRFHLKFIRSFTVSNFSAPSTKEWRGYYPAFPQIISFGIRLFD